MHLYSTFSVDPLNFPLEENLYQNCDFSRFLRLYRPLFLSQNDEIWHAGADLGLPPQSKFYFKNRVRGILLFGKFIPKITNLGYFGSCKPHFTSDNGYICHEGTGPGVPLYAKFCENRLTGYTHLDIQKVTNFGDFAACKPTFLKAQPCSLA